MKPQRPVRKHEGILGQCLNKDMDEVNIQSRLAFDSQNMQGEQADERKGFVFDYS